ncbi:avidin/streptavidin family protein [Paraburkholderia madseniana]|nr:avidin/streptavidin family protein [Paraburkholderia madseniana]
MIKSAEQTYFSTKTVAPTATVDFNGHWVNELTSFMDLTVSASGDVTGTYVSAVSDQGGPTPPFPLSGTVSGDLISFRVNWGEAITSWVGHGVVDAAGKSQILTLWYEVMAVPDELNPEQQWRTVKAGADSFWQ